MTRIPILDINGNATSILSIQVDDPEFVGAVVWRVRQPLMAGYTVDYGGEATERLAAKFFDVRSTMSDMRLRVEEPS